MSKLFAFITGNLFAVMVIFLVAYLVGARFPGMAGRVGLA